MADNNKTIITRIQNRRGLKQDLPNPLRPGEIGFATDTRQIYIGADTSVTTDSFNKTAKFENIIGAKTVTTDLVNDQIIQFTVPHRRYDRNFFDGTVTSVTWLPTSNSVAENPSSGTVFAAGETEFRDLQQGGAFNTQGVTVVKNGIVLDGDASIDASHTNISSGTDYFFSAGTDVTTPHKLTFRTAPVQRDEIGVTYYSNSDVWAAITQSTPSGGPADVGTGGIGVTNVNGFHKQYNIPEYRELEEKNIRISASTGVGYIGLSPKHIIVSSDVKHRSLPVVSYSAISNGTLGSMLVSRNNQKTVSVPLTVSGSNVTVTVGTDDVGNFSAAGGYVLANLSSTTGWVDGKVLEISGVGATTLTATLPSNTAVAFKGVTSINSYAGGDITISVDDAQNITSADVLYFQDKNNVSELDNKAATVVSVNTNTKTVVATVAGVVDNDWENAEGNVTFITRKAGVANDIVITSASHGYDSGEQFTTANSDIGAGSITVSSITKDTFVVTSAVTITDPSASFIITPVVANANVYATPVVGVDISSNTSLSQAVTYFNENNDFFELRYPPGVDDSVYLTEKEAITKSSEGFRIFNDTKRTASTLQLIEDNYTKADSTVKAKFENWLTSMQSSNKINMFKSVAVNNPYSSDTFDTWGISVDSATDEVRFTSSEESRNFTSVVNNVYFDSRNSDIRGLLSVKTNIEILTKESQESGDSDAIFTAPKGADLPSSTSTVITDLEANVLQYDAVFIEYSMQDKSADTGLNYKRIGTLHITGEPNSSTAIVQDNFTDSRDGFTGNVTFSASFDTVGSTVEVTADNSLTPPVDVRMTFIRRSWSTL